MITIAVRFLGPSKDLAGTRSASLELVDNAQLDELRAALIDRFPKISAAPVPAWLMRRPNEHRRFTGAADNAS
ncbi:MAG: hypothetical protein IH897_11560 [Planctomycetes bacterium]|nr:hypothetical protein [Planctomycetota bacterium]